MQKVGMHTAHILLTEVKSKSGHMHTALTRDMARSAHLCKSFIKATTKVQDGSHVFFFCCYIKLNINHLFIHLNYFKKVNIYSSQINGVTFPPRYIFPS